MTDVDFFFKIGLHHSWFIIWLFCMFPSKSKFLQILIQLYELKISFLVYMLVLSNRTAMHKHFYRTESDFFCLSVITIVNNRQTKNTLFNIFIGKGFTKNTVEANLQKNPKGQRMDKGPQNNKYVVSTFFNPTSSI